MAHKNEYNPKQLLRTSALGLILCVVPVGAQAIDWTGATDTDWATSTNWDGGSIPTVADDAIINTTTNAPVIASAGVVNSSSYIGNTSTGALTIQNGGTLTGSNASFIGNDAGVTGTTTVTGTGSSWVSSGTFYVGYNGAGTLIIEDGGAVSNTDGYIGAGAGSTGFAIVSGAGTSWTNSEQLIVGDNGIGTLNIEDGGQVSNTYARIAQAAGSTGTATVTGVGSTWINSNYLRVGCAGEGTLNIENGGVVNNTVGHIGYEAGSTGTTTVTGVGSTWTNSSYISVGHYGAGTLTISDGAQVNNTAAYIANYNGSTGIVTVTGVGSVWTNSSIISIGHGNSGVTHGALIITDGAQVSNTTAYIGGYYDFDSTGTATVTGVGSSWTNSSSLYVGNYGVGTLTVESGGAVSNTYAIIGTYAGSTGTATVTGIDSSWTNSGALVVGYYGTGTLTIEDGGAVSNTDAYIGAETSSTGTATVTGTGSSWINSSYLYIGASGTGALTIENGGSVLNTWGHLGRYNDGVGMATVTGAGSTWRNSNYLAIGYEGTGILTIENSGAVSNTYGYIGRYAGSIGTATITGAGSTWTNSANLYVGDSGTGTLTVENGGAVSNTYGYIGAQTSSIGTATVTGAGSSWTNSGALVVGYYGTGTLTIEDGGAVSNTHAYIGAETSSTGTATVTGTGSSWINSSYLYIGASGTGALTIENGGSVLNTWGHLGRYNDGVGMATVTGAGSTWTNSDYLAIGYEGTGTLTISDSATVSSTAVTIAASAGSTGTLNIGAASGDTAVAAGTLSAPTVAFGSGTGTLLFNHTDTDYLFTPDITGAGTISAEGGVTTLTGELSSFTGTASATNNATLNIGTSFGGGLSVGTGGVIAANDIISGTVAVNDGGTLKGSGTVGGITVASGGIVAPGNSIGTLNVVGNISFASGSFFDVEMNATTSDLTHATGTATITGGTVRLSKELSTDTITLDTNYTILTADNAVNGTFDAVTLDSLFLTPTLSYDANNVYATVSRNGVSFLTAAYSFNETEVATALDGATSGAAFIAVALQPTVATAQAAMDRLSGEFHANIKSHVLDEDAAFAHLIIGKMNRTSRHCERSAAIHQTDSATENTSDGSPRRCAPRDDAGGYWATYYGSWQTQKSSTTHGFEADNNGFAFGRTEAINDNTDLGFALAYERADYELVTNQEDSATAKGQTYRAALYATQKHGPWSFKVGSQYNYHDYDTDRHVVFDGYDQRHKASYDAHSFTGYGEAAYTVVAGEKLQLQPYAELIYGYGLLTSFKETGDAGLRAGSDGFHEGRSTIGVRMEQKLMFDKTPATLSADLGWIHRIGGANPTGNYSMDGTGEFKSQGTTRTRDELTFSTGLNFSLAQNAALDLTYMTNQSKAGDKHSARVGVTVGF